MNIAQLTPDLAEICAEITELASQKNALILAHNYQIPAVQDIAHCTGDSLALSRIAAQAEEDIIVFCGVHFMAETAKILSPNKKVLIPVKEAGCSLADSITIDDLREWKAEHPDAVVVAYVNTTAEIKAEVDICCTSSNAVDIVATIDPDREVLFLPDQFLGAHVRRATGRDNIHVWAGECHVHAGINGDTLQETVSQHPQAELYIHPECGCATSALYLAGEGIVPKDNVHILSTGAMLDSAHSVTSQTVLVATEIGMLHQLQRAAPQTQFLPVNPQASCPYMKMITIEKLRDSLLYETDEVQVPLDIAKRAQASVQAMIAIGNPGHAE